MTTSVASAFRRISMLIGIARQSASSGQDGTIGTAQIGFPTGEVHDAAPIAQQFGFASAPPMGTDHITLHVQGDRTSSISIATNHQGHRPKGLKDGDSAQYDMRGQTLTFGPDGMIFDGNGLDLPLTVRNVPKVRIEGDLEVTGEITAKAGTGAAITLTPHTHTDSRGGTTSAPNSGT